MPHRALPFADLLAGLQAAGLVVRRHDIGTGRSLRGYYHQIRVPDDVRPFPFAWRKFGGQLVGKSREALFHAIRLTSNGLPGYVASYALRRVADDLQFSLNYF